MNSQAPPEEIVVTDGMRDVGFTSCAHDDTGVDGDEEAKICGYCLWIRKPRRWTIERLRKAAEEGPVPLLREVDALRRQRFWCSRESCWTHLLDNACSLWQPMVT